MSQEKQIDPKFCPACKNYTDHELVRSCENCGDKKVTCSQYAAVCSVWKPKENAKESNHWKCSICGAVDQYKNNPAKKSKPKVRKCDCGGLLVKHPDGSGLLQCEKCKCSVFIMDREPPKDDYHTPNAPGKLPGSPLIGTPPGVHFENGRLPSFPAHPPGYWPPMEREEEKPVPPNAPAATATEPGVTHPPATADSSPVATPSVEGMVEERDGKGAIDVLTSKSPYQQDTPPKTPRGNEDSRHEPLAVTVNANDVPSAVGNGVNCLKCGANSWAIDFDNILETCTCKHCGFKSIGPCPYAIFKGNDVYVCKHSGASCNGTRIEKKCPRRSKIKAKPKTIKEVADQEKPEKKQMALF